MAGEKLSNLGRRALLTLVYDRGALSSRAEYDYRIAEVNYRKKKGHPDLKTAKNTFINADQRYRDGYNLLFLKQEDIPFKP